MRLRYVPFVASVVAAGGLVAGCDSGERAEYGGVCVDPATHKRVDDDRCDDDWNEHGVVAGHGVYWMWFPMGYGGHVPAVGETARGGLRRVPAGAAVATGVPVKGASSKAGGMRSIQRGGFGAKAVTVGGKVGAGS